MNRFMRVSWGAVILATFSAGLASCGEDSPVGPRDEPPQPAGPVPGEFEVVIADGRRDATAYRLSLAGGEVRQVSAAAADGLVIEDSTSTKILLFGDPIDSTLLVIQVPDISVNYSVSVVEAALPTDELISPTEVQVSVVERD